MALPITNNVLLLFSFLIGLVCPSSRVFSCSIFLVSYLQYTYFQHTPAVQLIYSRGLFLLLSLSSLPNNESMLNCFVVFLHCIVCNSCVVFMDNFICVFLFNIAPIISFKSIMMINPFHFAYWTLQDQWSFMTMSLYHFLNTRLNKQFMLFICG